MNAITDAIKNLEVMSRVLETHANKSENNDSEFSNYLEILSWEMLKQANELKSMNYIYGEV